jgi:hypothetical protein
MSAILGASWASWGIKYGWNGENDKVKKEKKWWQLKRIAVGLWVIIFLIAFGILQPLLWVFLPTNPPTSATTMSNLLTILIALFALILTSFSVLIYEVLHKELKTRITKDIKSTEEKVHERIEAHVKEISERAEELSKRAEEEIKNNQTLFMVRVQRNMGYLFWNLFEVEKIKEKGKITLDSTTKIVSKKLINLAINRAEYSLKFSRELPEIEYKVDIYRCKSNWIYFLADAVGVKDYKLTKKDKELALKIANEILEDVSKQDYPDYYEYQENCAWALQRLSEEEDKISKQKAGDIIRELINDLNIPHTRREEIEKKWAPFLEEIEKNSDTANL